MVNSFSKALLPSLWLLVAALGLPGCNTSGLVGGECARGLSACGHQCVNLGSDEENCGSCGRGCKSDELCRAGTCMQGNETGSTEPTDSTSTASNASGSSGSSSSTGDGGSDAPDSDTTSDVSTGPEAGTGDPCFAPYNSAENCGACGAACTAEAPFCAPAGDTFECVDGCDDPLRLCADRCVDTTTDPLHCGRCGNACPTGLCRESECVGGHAGHLVALCMSFEQVFANSPQAVLLANAVFLATSPMTRVMVFDAFAPNAAKNQVRSIISSAGATRGRQVRIDVASTPADVVSALKIANYEVLVIADTSLAPSGAVRDMGRAISTTLDSFTQAGGVVVITSGSAATEMPEFWGSDGASLFDVRGVPDVTFTELQNRAPADAVAANVLTPFLALTSTCVLEMSMDVGADTEVVISGLNPGDAGGELPVVLHRVIVP